MKHKEEATRKNNNHNNQGEMDLWVQPRKDTFGQTHGRNSILDQESLNKEVGNELSRKFISVLHTMIRNLIFTFKKKYWGDLEEQAKIWLLLLDLDWSILAVERINKHFATQTLLDWKELSSSYLVS
jgi:hypothetical protein